MMMKIVMAILMIYDDDYSDDGNDFLTLKNPRKVVVTLLFYEFPNLLQEI